MIDLRDILATPKRCARCKQQDDREVALDADVAYVRWLGQRATVWTCPECGKQVFRGADPQLFDPPQ